VQPTFHLPLVLHPTETAELVGAGGPDLRRVARSPSVAATASVRRPGPVAATSSPSIYTGIGLALPRVSSSSLRGPYDADLVVPTSARVHAQLLHGEARDYATLWSHRRLAGSLRCDCAAAVTGMAEIVSSSR
jgi:hypothetical protein